LPLSLPPAPYRWRVRRSLPSFSSGWRPLSPQVWDTLLRACSRESTHQLLTRDRKRARLPPGLAMVASSPDELITIRPRTGTQSPHHRPRRTTRPRPRMKMLRLCLRLSSRIPRIPRMRTSTLRVRPMRPEPGAALFPPSPSDVTDSRISGRARVPPLEFSACADVMVGRRCPNGLGPPPLPR